MEETLSRTRPGQRERTTTNKNLGKYNRNNRNMQLRGLKCLQKGTGREKAENCEEQEKVECRKGA